MAIDPRNIVNGYELPSEGYCDQPFVVQTDDGGWLCVMTTGSGHEGASGQHMVAIKSFDKGKTWTMPIPIESADEPASSWGVPLKVPSGRVYCFYTYNGDNLREVISDRGPIKRVDTLGYYAFKYSDDNGLTWSAKRFYIPVRKFKMDYENPYGGDVVFFWGVSKPIIHDGVVYFGFAKVGRFGDGFMASSEGAFMKSDNILSESDPEKINWETLPDGDMGLRSPIGPVSDEHNLVALSDGSLFCTFRTTEGHNCCSYSRDGGHTWDKPIYCSYTPGGKQLKHPRAANFVRKYANGKFTLWFHNHGGKWYGERNPAWILGGIEKNGYIHWSQPEVLLYDDNPDVRISYPDFIEDDGKFYVTETQKTIARVHEMDPALLDGIWRHDEICEVARDGLALELIGSIPSEAAMPTLGDLRTERGFSIELWGKLPICCGNDDVHDGFKLNQSSIPAECLLDSRTAAGDGVLIAAAADGAVEIVLSDGRTVSSWQSDHGLLQPGTTHHVIVTVDAGPKIISFVVDGVFCDGGEERQFGWGRFSPHLTDVTGSEALQANPALSGLRIYTRPLRTSEAVGNYRASE